MENLIVRNVVHLYQMFDLTKDEYDKLVEKCMFNEEMSKILELRIKGYSRTQISMMLNISERTYDRRIRFIKNKIMKVL